nr:MAG TPA: Large polyvalent protein associated domain 29 [Caudoviricetes sp.]
MNYTIAKNNQFNSIEINFSGKPCEAIRSALKNIGFRWHSVRRIWYGYADEQTTKNAIENADDAEVSNILNDKQNPDEKAKAQTAKAIAKAAAHKLPSLWERCDISDIEQHNKHNLPPVKEVAAILRKELKKRFPEVKFSITSTHNSISAYIQASPYERRHIMKDRRTGEPDGYGYFEDSDELNAVQAYCKALADSWNYDNSDSMTDYAEKEAAEHAAFLAKCEADRIQREKDAEAARIQEQITAAKVEKINKTVKVVDLAESEQIAIQRLTEYRKICSLKEVEKIDNYNAENDYEPTTTDAVISRKIEFSNDDIYNDFCDLFMCDFEFLRGKGGTSTADARVDKNNYLQLNEEQRKTVFWFCSDCIGVYLNGKLKFVIDPQGFSYARYILTLPNDFDEQKDTTNAQEYIKALEDYSRTLPAFYIPRPISEQIATANLQEGDSVTVLTVNDWILIANEYRGTLNSIETKKWAQYSDAGKITITRKGKRKTDDVFFHKGSMFVLYRGILPEVPNNLKYGNVSHGLQAVNYAGASFENYIKNVIAYYKQLGFEPIINTIAR